MKHTQGTWIVQNDGNDNAEYIYCEETTQWICQMNRLVIKVPKLEQERRNANAKLIAAAPDLLAALKLGLRGFVSSNKALRGAGFFDDEMEQLEKQVTSRITDAIAKATP